MNVFIRIVLIASGAFIVVEAIPLAWFNFVLCWSIIIVAAYVYPHHLIDKVQAMSSSVGFAVGMGAAIGALVNTLGMIGAFVVHSIFFGLAATAHRPDEFGALAGSASAVGDMMQLVGAPFWGAALGAVGGLVGGSTIPRGSRAQ